MPPETGHYSDSGHYSDTGYDSDSTPPAETGHYSDSGHHSDTGPYGDTDWGGGNTDSGGHHDSGSHSDSGSDSCGQDSGPVVEPWSDVQCGAVTCSGNDVCVVSPLGCDYSPCRKGMEAEWTGGDLECQPFPAHCDPSNPVSCLQLEYCQPYPEFANFQGGVLECEPLAGDCYCGI